MLARTANLSVSLNRRTEQDLLEAKISDDTASAAAETSA